jgi:hypothetical protein
MLYSYLLKLESAKRTGEGEREKKGDVTGKGELLRQI